MQFERGHGSFSSGASFNLDVRGVNRTVSAKHASHFDECADGDQSFFLIDARCACDVDCATVNDPVADKAGSVRQAVDDAVKLKLSCFNGFVLHRVD